MKTIEQTSIKAGSYYTIAAASGCVIEYVGQAADGAQLRLGKYQHKPEQEWSFVRVGDNAYRIHCRANNKVVDLVAAGTGRGTWLHLWDDVMGSSQVWVLTRNNDGTVQISSPSVRKIRRTRRVSAPRARSVAISPRFSAMSIARAPTTENDATTSTSSAMRKMPHFS